MSDALDPALFIGSSTESLAIAEYLQAELDFACQATIWTQGIFSASKNVMNELLQCSSRMDFAALVLAPDDELSRRGRKENTVRDNVIFELGLFLGALGQERVFIVAPRGEQMALPSDLAGIVMLDYRPNRADNNFRAALGPAARAIKDGIQRYGLRGDRKSSDVAEPTDTSAARRGLTLDEERAELDRELDAITTAAEAQGWSVKTRSKTAYRLIAINGQRYSLTIGSPAETRDELRKFAKQLREAGLRISQAVLRPV